MMDQCKQTYMFLISFTLGGEAGLAIVSALDERQAIQVLRSSGKGNCCPKSYTIHQTRDIGLTTTGFGLLMESYVDARVAYDAIVKAIDGIHGLDGLSAYEIAVKHGFEGTEEEWLESLVIGKDGLQFLVDDALSLTSKRPVENRVITAALNAKQDKLISGQNIKTINNQSILGSGNISIQGGGSGPNVIFRVEGTRLIITTSGDTNIRVEGTKLILN